MVNEFETNSSAYTTVLERVAYMIKQKNLKKIKKKNWQSRRQCKFKINLSNLLCMAENIFEDAPEVVKENCKVVQGKKKRIMTMKKYLRVKL